MTRVFSWIIDQPKRSCHKQAATMSSVMNKKTKTYVFSLPNSSGQALNRQISSKDLS